MLIDNDGTIAQPMGNKNTFAIKIYEDQPNLDLGIGFLAL